MKLKEAAPVLAVMSTVSLAVAARGLRDRIRKAHTLPGEVDTITTQLVERGNVHET
jgi:hypothetical protein